jgi:hypothetical protein
MAGAPATGPCSNSDLRFRLAGPWTACKSLPLCQLAGRGAGSNSSCVTSHLRQPAEQRGDSPVHRRACKLATGKRQRAARGPRASPNPIVTLFSKIDINAKWVQDTGLLHSRNSSWSGRVDPSTCRFCATEPDQPSLRDNRPTHARRPNQGPLTHDILQMESSCIQKQLLEPIRAFRPGLAKVHSKPARRILPKKPRDNSTDRARANQEPLAWRSSFS